MDSNANAFFSYVANWQNVVFGLGVMNWSLAGDKPLS